MEDYNIKNPQKLKVVMSEDTANDLKLLQLLLKLRTLSGTITMCIKTTLWVINKQKEGYKILAQKDISAKKYLEAELPNLLEK